MNNKTLKKSIMKVLTNIKIMLRSFYVEVTYSILMNPSRIFVKLLSGEGTTEIKPKVPDSSIPVTTDVGTVSAKLAKLYTDSAAAVSKADISLGPVSIPNEHAVTFLEAQPLVTGLVGGVFIGGVTFSVWYVTRNSYIARMTAKRIEEKVNMSIALLKAEKLDPATLHTMPMDLAKLQTKAYLQWLTQNHPQLIRPYLVQARSQLQDNVDTYTKVAREFGLPGLVLSDVAVIRKDVLSKAPVVTEEVTKVTPGTRGDSLNFGPTCDTTTVPTVPLPTGQFKYTPRPVAEIKHPGAAENLVVNPVDAGEGHINMTHPLQQLDNDRLFDSGAALLSDPDSLLRWYF